MTQSRELAALRYLQEPDVDRPLPDDPEIAHLSATRSQIASEIGAAMVHELNGPMTALLLYIGDIHQKKNRMIDSGGDTAALKQVIDSAFHEAERICSLIHRIGNYFEAPISKETAIPVARDAIAWWSRTGHPEGRSPTDVGRRLAEEGKRPCAKPLTPREREVLQLVSEGCSNKQGAMQLNISYRTFECHRAEVMRKLGAKNTAELVRLTLLDRPGSSASRASCGT